MTITQADRMARGREVATAGDVAAIAPRWHAHRWNRPSVYRWGAALRRDEIVAVPGDRALGDRSDVPVPFFGADAPFPLEPFVLARAAAAPVVPAFCVLGRDRRYTITVGEAMRVDAGGERAVLACWVEILEAAVRRHPEQWFNVSDLWRDAPAR